VYVKLPAIISATVIVCHAVTVLPDLLITPHPGTLCIITLDNPFAGESFGSVNGKSPVQKTYVVLSNAIIVLLVPDGASLTLVTEKVKLRHVFSNQSVTETPIVLDPFWFAIGYSVSVHIGGVQDFAILIGAISHVFKLVSETLPEQFKTLSTSKIVIPTVFCTSSLVVCGEVIALSVGESFTQF